MLSWKLCGELLGRHDKTSYLTLYLLVSQIKLIRASPRCCHILCLDWNLIYKLISLGRMR